MRQRFRVRDEFFAAETFALGDQFEVKVFSLRPADGYFKREGARPVVCLRGSDERELLRQALLRTREQGQKRGWGQ